MSKKSSPPKKSSENSPNFLTLGAPLLDLVVPVTDAFLYQIEGQKGGMELVSHNTFQEILLKVGKPPQYFVGGSASNVAKGLNGLGNAQVSFAGTLGMDSEGALFKENMESLGIELFASYVSEPTGKCLSLITPDSKRTMRTFLGASQQISLKTLPKEMFKNRHLIHFEGYLIDRDHFLEDAIKEGKKEKALISLDLGSFEIAENYRERLIKLIKNNVDILFCNAEEAQALTELPLHEACQKLTDLCLLTVVSDGAKGGFVGSMGEIFSYEAFSVRTVDTTGAGDYFASGFLWGLMHKFPLKTCAEIGARIASYIVQILGTDLSLEAYQELRKLYPLRKSM